MKIKIVHLEKNQKGEKIASFDVSEGTILQTLIKLNEQFIAPCGGQKKCGKCLVDVEINGKRKIVHSCSTPIVDRMVIYLKDQNETKFNNVEFNDLDEYALCMDLGTTSIVYYLINKNTNDILATLNFANPQAIFGSDVISRIQYANENGIRDLQTAVISLTNNVLSDIKDYCHELYVCGNPTMLHLFIGKDVKTLGEYPYQSLFLESLSMNGAEIGLPEEVTVQLLPSFSTFVGSDLSAGFLETKLNEGNNMIIDLGTNGEIVLNYNDKIYATSTAAGPAFEGIGITCGCGSVDGAINRVYLKEQDVVFETINDCESVGLTGSGLVDIVSILKNQNIIDFSGKFMSSAGIFNISKNVFINQKDVRAFQLAKSAICTGIELLLDSAKAKPESIQSVYLAGGFGQYIDIENAINVGLLPTTLKGKYISAGNTAGKGTIKYALNKGKINGLSYQEFLAEITKKAEIIELNKHPLFLDKFTDNMEI